MQKSTHFFKYFGEANVASVNRLKNVKNMKKIGQRQESDQTTNLK